MTIDNTRYFRAPSFKNAECPFDEESGTSTAEPFYQVATHLCAVQAQTLEGLVALVRLAH